MTRRRIASTMRWSWVAITIVVPVRLIHLGYLGADDVTRAPDDFHRERDVLVDGAVGQELEVLEDAPDVAAQLGHFPVTQLRDVAPGHDNSPGGGLLLPEQEPQEGGFPRPGRTDEEDEFALLHLGGDVSQRADIALVDLGNVLEENHRCGSQ